MFDDVFLTQHHLTQIISPISITSLIQSGGFVNSEEKLN
jgi:hypothetical protein